MITCTVEELYEVVATRGALTRTVERERMVSYMRFSAGIAAQPVVVDEDAEPLSGYAPTVPDRRGSTRRAGT